MSAIAMLRQPSLRSADNKAVGSDCCIADREIPKQREREDCSPKGRSLCAGSDPIHAVRQRQAEDCTRHQRQEPSNLSLEAAGMNEEEDQSGTTQQPCGCEKCPNPIR